MYATRAKYNSKHATTYGTETYLLNCLSDLENLRIARYMILKIEIIYAFIYVEAVCRIFRLNKNEKTTICITHRTGVLEAFPTKLFRN